MFGKTSPLPSSGGIQAASTGRFGDFIPVIFSIIFIRTFHIYFEKPSNLITSPLVAVPFIVGAYDPVRGLSSSASPSGSDGSASDQFIQSVQFRIAHFGFARLGGADGFVGFLRTLIFIFVTPRLVLPAAKALLNPWHPAVSLRFTLSVRI